MVENALKFAFNSRRQNIYYFQNTKKSGVKNDRAQYKVLPDNGWENGS